MCFISVRRCSIRSFVRVLGFASINCSFVLRILIHVGCSASPPSGPYAADGSTAISIVTDGAFSVFGIDLDGDGDVGVLSASRTDGTVAWYVYLVRGCGHRHKERKIPIRLGMSERQKDGGDECIRAMENRRENARRTPSDRSLSLAHQVRKPLHELLRVDARPGPVADARAHARADPGADAGSDNAPADAARELITRRLPRRRRRAGGSCSTSRSRRTRRRRSTRPSRPRAFSCRATGCASRKNLARAGWRGRKAGCSLLFLADLPICGSLVRFPILRDSTPLLFLSFCFG